LESKRLGRTQDPTILVLTSLTGGPKHGYAIIKDIEEMTAPSLDGHPVRRARAPRRRGPHRGVGVEGSPPAYRITGAGSAVLTERLRSAMKVATIVFDVSERSAERGKVTGRTRAALLSDVVE